MEGILAQVQTGLFGGTKKHFCLIDGADFVVHKGVKGSKEILRIPLESGYQVNIQGAGDSV